MANGWIGVRSVVVRSYTVWCMVLAILALGCRGDAVEGVKVAGSAQALSQPWGASGQTILADSSLLGYVEQPYKDDLGYQGTLVFPSRVFSYRKALNGSKGVLPVQPGFGTHQARVNAYTSLLRDALTRPEFDDKEDAKSKLKAFFRNSVSTIAVAQEYAGYTADALDEIASALDASAGPLKSVAHLKEQFSWMGDRMAVLGGAMWLNDAMEDAMIYLALVDADAAARLDAFDAALAAGTAVDPALRQAYCGVSSGPCVPTAGVRGEILQATNESQARMHAFVNHFRTASAVTADNARDDLDGLVGIVFPWGICAVLGPVSLATCGPLLGVAAKFNSASTQLEFLRRDMLASAAVLHQLFPTNRYESLNVYASDTDLLTPGGLQDWHEARLQAYLAYRHATTAKRMLVLSSDEVGLIASKLHDFTLSTFKPQSADQTYEFSSRATDARLAYFGADRTRHAALIATPPAVPLVVQESPWARVGRPVRFDASLSQGGELSSSRQPSYEWYVDGVRVHQSPGYGQQPTEFEHVFATSGAHQVTLTVVPEGAPRSMARSHTLVVQLEPAVVGTPILSPGTPLSLFSAWSASTPLGVGGEVTFQATVDLVGKGSTDVSDGLEILAFPSSRVSYDEPTRKFTIAGAGPVVFLAYWEGEPLAGYRTDSFFSDVHPSDWFAQYVEPLVDRDVLQGYSDGTYKPAQAVTRAEFVKMAIAARDVNPPHDWNQSPYAVPNPFSDVGEADWFFSYVMVALANGVVSSASQFRPSEPLNRAEAVRILVDAFALSAPLPPQSAFWDVSLGDWFGPDVHVAVQRGLVEGYPDGSFKPAATINRAEASKIVCKALGGACP